MKCSGRLDIDFHEGTGEEFTGISRSDRIFEMPSHVFRRRKSRVSGLRGVAGSELDGRGCGWVQSTSYILGDSLAAEQDAAGAIAGITSLSP